MDSLIPLLQDHSLSREILDQIPLIVIVADRTGSIVYVNPAVETILGYQPADALGDGWWNLTRSEARDPEKERLQIEPRILDESRHGAPYESSLPDSEGRERIIAWRDFPGPNHTLIGYGQDITDQRRSEESLRAARQAAELASRAKTEFLANMSHELRTPMNAVTGAASLLLDTALDAKQKELVEVTRNSGLGLLHLVDDILDFSRIETESLDLEERPFDVWATLEEAVGAVAYQAANKGLDLGFEISPDVPRRLIGDAVRVRQILVNLLANAVKFTRRGWIRARLELASGQPDDFLELRFTVEDSGIGIPEDRREQIFDSFSQVDASITRRYGGTGLGLAISRRLCELMGGAIAVESEAGVGSTFTFTIVGRERASEPEDHTTLEKALANRRVLSVGLGRASFAALRSALRRWQVELVEYEGGPHEPSPDLVFLRLGVGEPGSADAWLSSPTAVVAVSSVADEPAAERLDQAVVQVIAPLRPSEVARALRLVFNLTSPVIRQSEPGDGAELAKLRVLLAEDNPVNQMIGLMMLERLGLEADVASNGLQVLESIVEKPYDVILMDVQMPELDGLEATRQIRGLLQSGVQIIAVTANATAADREQCLEVGMDSYLSKPFELEALRDELAACRRLSAAEMASTRAGAQAYRPTQRTLCPFITRCPMFPLFENEPIRRVYQLAYCKADFEECHRYHLASQGTMPDPRLLPDGGMLPKKSP